MSAPPARKRRIDEIGEESRRRILDAAEALFAERGFERTSFASIARRSGISRGSIPWHFANKDGLLIAVVERALARQVVESRSIEQGDLGKVMDDVKRWMHQPTAAMLYTLLTEALSTDREDPGSDRRPRCRSRASRQADRSQTSAGKSAAPHYLPVNFGGRFSNQAFDASLRSSVP